MKKNFLSETVKAMASNGLSECDVHKIGDPNTFHFVGWSDFMPMANFFYGEPTADQPDGGHARVRSFKGYVITFHNGAWIEFNHVNCNVIWSYYKKPEFAQEEVSIGDQVTYCPACDYPASLKVINEYYISQDEPCPDCGKHSLAEFVEKQ